MKFTIFFTFFKQKKFKQMEEFQNNLKVLGEFSHVEDFWNTYEHMKKPSDVSGGCQFFCFRESVKPLWEDPQNVGGCKFFLSLKKSELSNEMWEKLLIGFIGIEKESKLNGVSLNIRKAETIISIWLSKA